MKNNHKLLFITGLMRSGTTMIANFLNSQNNITIFRDYGMFLKSIATSPYSETENFDEKFKNIIIANAKAEAKSQAFLNINLKPSDISNSFNAFKEFLLPISKEEDFMIGNKVTNALPLLEKMLNYHDFKGIYIYRDIRSVINSGKNRFFADSYSIIYQIHIWKSNIFLINKLKKKHDNLLVIKYEDFVTGKISDEIEEFIGSRLDWNMKNLKDRNNESDNWIGNTSFSNLKQEKLKGIYTSNLNTWSESIIKDIELQFADYICRNELEKLGYKTTQYPLNKRIKFSYRYKTYKIINNSKKIIRKIFSI